MAGIPSVMALKGGGNGIPGSFFGGLSGVHGFPEDIFHFQGLVVFQQPWCLTELPGSVSLLTSVRAS